MLWRASAGGALRTLDSDGAARTRLGRSLLRPLGIPCSVFRSAAAGDSHFHRAAGGDCTHAARTVSPVYVSGIVAVVSGAGISRHEAGPELARVRKILSQVRRADWSAAGGRNCVVCLDSLAEPDADGSLARGLRQELAPRISGLFGGL